MSGEILTAKFIIELRYILDKWDKGEIA